MASLNELKANLETYEEQFNQERSILRDMHADPHVVSPAKPLNEVEAALTIDPHNEQLVKLRTDLQEVIDLTQELIRVSVASGEATASLSHDTSAVGHGEDRVWKVGDKCMATWSSDQQLYPCVIDEILDDGTCSVIFEGYNQSEVTQVSSLKPYDVSRAKESRNKRDKALAEREYKRAKNQKKKQRLKQQEEEREGEKNKWKNFNAKLEKTGKSKVKQSIFATSEHVTGKVGVGTCGISGKPMTTFCSAPKYLKKT